MTKSLNDGNFKQLLAFRTTDLKMFVGEVVEGQYIVCLCEYGPEQTNKQTKTAKATNTLIIFLSCVLSEPCSWAAVLEGKVVDVVAAFGHQRSELVLCGFNTEHPCQGELIATWLVCRATPTAPNNAGTWRPE